jgi:hypothetical protein
MYAIVPQVMGTYNPPIMGNQVMVKGKPWIECSGTATVAEIKQALIDADMTDVAFIQGSTFTFYGILRSTGTLAFTDMAINCYWGMIGGSSGAYTHITYLRCNVQLLEAHYGSYLRSTGTNTNFLFESKGQQAVNLGPVYQCPIGVGNAFNTVIVQ